MGRFSFGFASFARVPTIVATVVSPSSARKIHDDRQVKLKKAPLRDNGELRLP